MDTKDSFFANSLNSFTRPATKLSSSPENASIVSRGIPPFGCIFDSGIAPVVASYRQSTIRLWRRLRTDLIGPLIWMNLATKVISDGSILLFHSMHVENGPIAYSGEFRTPNPEPNRTVNPEPNRTPNPG